MSGVGNIPRMSGSMANYTFGDTPAAEANQLQWIKIQDDDKTLLICDRIILVSCSWNDLNGQGYIAGKEVTIDGAKYKCRVLTGGSNYRNSSDAYAGGTPTNNEWDRFITREEVITGLPAPVSSDLDSTLNTTDENSAHNALWHWAGVYSWCQETYSGNSSYRANRGYYSARHWGCNTATGQDALVGFRPVLEVLNTDPLISDSDRDLGDKNSNFTITYTVDDADSGDVLAATESIEGRTTKSFAPTRKAKNTISINIREHSLGSHTVKVVVTDGQGGTATRTWTFTRVNSAPTISGSDTNFFFNYLGTTLFYTFVSKKVDLIMANATPALQAAYNATAEIPILGTSVTEYGVALGIDNFSGTVGGNVSGTSDLAPLTEQADMILELLPETKTVGLLYCSAEPNSEYQVQVVEEYLTGKGITCTRYSFSDSNDVAAVTTKAAADSDVIYIPTDNTAASCTETIGSIVLNAKTPVVAGEKGLCTGCGVATLSISYYDLGYKTGEMAAQVLTGEADIAEMPIQYAPATKMYNPTMCEALGITAPEGYEAME